MVVPKKKRICGLWVGDNIDWDFIFRQSSISLHDRQRGFVCKSNVADNRFVRFGKFRVSVFHAMTRLVSMDSTTVSLYDASFTLGHPVVSLILSIDLFPNTHQ